MCFINRIRDNIMFVLFVSFLLICKFHISNCDCANQKKFFRKADFNDVHIIENALWTEAKDSAAHCGSDCVRDGGCVSFFYNTHSGACSAHGVEFMSTGPGVEDAGSVYYSLVVVKDCTDILNNDPSSPDGVYTINPLDGTGPLNVYCDMTTDGGRWTVFQRRINSTTDFYRNWTDYKNGFGDLNGNFWLGNDYIHLLTVQRSVELRIDMLDQEDESGVATYSIFKIGNETENYHLSVDGYSGNRGDSMIYMHNGMQFSTFDRDNDQFGANCAVLYGGAWWYRNCHVSNLNGVYGDTVYGRGINWVSWHDHYYSLKWTEMKLRST